mmetsp:Transcript_54477/g.162795  ORF Transcript_54477/g.162795 Transcript_54477/m.162795 type:complete len:86 (+) Transcript_54477:387-644(+)
MLSQMDWKEEDGGIGRHRQGSMVPVKVRLKMDKKGLGMNHASGDARVTHRHVERRSNETNTVGADTGNKVKRKKSNVRGRARKAT